MWIIVKKKFSLGIWFDLIWTPIKNKFSFNYILFVALTCRVVMQAVTVVRMVHCVDSYLAQRVRDHLLKKNENSKKLIINSFACHLVLGIQIYFSISISTANLTSKTSKNFQSASKKSWIFVTNPIKIDFFGFYWNWMWIEIPTFGFYLFNKIRTFITLKN
jgi:hypothetical protein